MNLIAMLLTIFSLFAFQPQASANEKPLGEIPPQRVEQVMATAESYMLKNYKLTLINEDYSLINTYNYVDVVKKHNRNAKGSVLNLAASTYIPDKNLIIINMRKATDKTYNYLFTHELMHKYQEQQILQDKLNPKGTFHAGLKEGIADELTSKITGLQLVKPVNHGIAFSHLATEADLEKAYARYGAVKTAEQCAFFASEYLNIDSSKLYVAVRVEKGHKH